MNQAPLQKNSSQETACDSIHSLKDLQQKIELMYFPESQQAAAKYIKGYSIEEIAKLTGKSQDEVSRLLKLLLRLLNRG